MEARAEQITANRNYTSASDAYLAATDRLSKADDALVSLKDAAQTPAPVSFLDGVTFVETTLNGSAE